MMSAFCEVPAVAPDVYSETINNYKRDPSKEKIDLASEEYRDVEGNIWILPSVKTAEQQIHDTEPIVPDYYYPNSHLFLEHATKILLGEDSPAIKENRVCSIHTPSGTGALRLGAHFLLTILGKSVYYYSNPTYEAHLQVFNNIGFKTAKPYRYWCPAKREIDFEGLTEDLRNAPAGAVILLHASGHYPTGMDLSKDQWKQLAKIIKEKRLLPFFHSVGQGLTKGVDEDAWAIRYFVEEGLEFFCAQSFTENGTLYSEPVGHLLIVTESSRHPDNVMFYIAAFNRRTFLVAASYANRVLGIVWSRSELRKQWEEELEVMRIRVSEARKQLRAALERLGTPGEWSFITKQNGVSSLIGLSESQVEYMASKFHIYLLPSGRVNISAMIPSRIDYIAKAVHETIISVGAK